MENVRNNQPGGMGVAEQNKKDVCYVGKNNKHLITVICNDNKMTVTIHSIDDIKVYHLYLCR